MKWVALIYAAEWISVGLAVSTAIHVTGNLRALWFFLIPALAIMMAMRERKNEVLR